MRAFYWIEQWRSTRRSVWKELRNEPKFKGGSELQDGKPEKEGEEDTPGRKAAKRLRELEKQRQDELETNKRVAISLEEKNALIGKKMRFFKRDKINFFSHPNCPPPELAKRFFEQQAAQYLGLQEGNADTEVEEIDG
jgi:hypothetical protein